MFNRKCFLENVFPEAADCRRTPGLCAADAECVQGADDVYVCVCRPGYRGDGASCSRKFSFISSCVNTGSTVNFTCVFLIQFLFWRYIFMIRTKFKNH